MAGAKETPRQKLISLMYLVFITMLALNVSKEVLDGFGQMFKKIQSSNIRLDQSNDVYYNKISTNAAEKEGKWLGFSEYILQTSTPEEIKNEIIEKLGNLGDKKALSPLIEIIDENDLGIVATSLSKIVKKNKLENSKEILKFLKSNEEGMKRMGASMLKGILEE